MVEHRERVTGFINPATGRKLSGPIIEVGVRDGRLYYVMQLSSEPDLSVASEPSVESLDLHAWISRQVDQAAKAEAPHTRDCCSVPQVFSCCGSEDGCECSDTFPCDCLLPAAAQRRIEADRRVLARHKVDPESADSPTFATACDGCRSEWVQDDCEPLTANLNDCPELLDLAHAHGITPEILAALHRPQPPERKLTPPSPFAQVMAQAYGPAMLNGLQASLRFGRPPSAPVELPREHPEEP